MFERYLEMLDYSRNIFTQADMDSFKAWSLQLDDQLKAGDNQIAYDLYNLSMENVLSAFNTHFLCLIKR